MAESELIVLSRRCLDSHVPGRGTLVIETTACMRDLDQSTIDRRFTTADSGIKLKRLYPALLR